MTYSLDANHSSIVRAFQQLGAMVIDNARVKRLEPGQLDLWVGLPNPYGGPGVWIYVEVKTSTGRLRPEQQQTIAQALDCGLPVEVVRSTADVDALYCKYLERMKL